MIPKGTVGSNPTLSAIYAEDREVIAQLEDIEDILAWRSTQEAEEDGLLNR